MTLDERFERTLPTILDDLYLGPTPDYRDDLLWQTARTSQRPAWRFPGRWLPMADLVTERVVAPRVPLRMIALALLIIALLVAGTVAFVGSQQPKLPAPFGIAHNGLIAFQQAGDIVTLDPVTAKTRVLVSGPEQDSAPLYSNDGTKIAFERVEPSGGVALYVVDSDGSDPVRVTPDPIDNVLARSFSPDGRSLLVTAWTLGRAGIFEVATDGSRPPRTLDVRLPTDSNNVEAPAYRPTDGSQVLVTELASGDFSRSVALVDLDAGTKRTLIWSPPADQGVWDIYGATWSPNGEWISYGKFDQTSDDVTSRVHVMAADGSGDRVIDAFPGTTHDSPGPWSNDSTKMIVERGYATDLSDERMAVVSIDPTGGSKALECPTLGGGTCGGGWSWSPDDTSLLGVLDADGPSPHYLLADPGNGIVTETPWPAGGDSSWQRVGP